MRRAACYGVASPSAVRAAAASASSGPLSSYGSEAPGEIEAGKQRQQKGWLRGEGVRLAVMILRTLVA